MTSLIRLGEVSRYDLKAALNDCGRIMIGVEQQQSNFLERIVQSMVDKSRWVVEELCGWA